MSNEGQNRHLKLRLSKGAAQFDGIFFSTTAEDCGCIMGERVDAAFYLQINEFRGNRSVQLQMVDMRPSLYPSSKEQECLTLLKRFMTQQPITGKDARRLCPNREQSVAAWRTLEHLSQADRMTTMGYLPLLRTVSAHMGKNESFLRSALSLEVFQERELLHLEWDDEVQVSFRLLSGKKVSLADSPYLQRINSLLGTGGRG